MGLDAQLRILVGGGGPLFYVVGTTLFRRAVGGSWPRLHLLGVLLLAACVPLARFVTALGLAMAVTGALLIIATVETVRLRKGKDEAA